MLAIRLAIRSVTRRGWNLLLVVLPAALLFAMLTFLVSSEATVRQLVAPGIAQRAFRIGAVEGLAKESMSFSRGLVKRLEMPGVEMAPASFSHCTTDPDQPADTSCAVTNRTYIQIWAFDMPVSEADLDKWDAVKNGAIISRALATRHGWHVGDHIQLYFNNFKDLPHLPLELQITSISEKYIDPTTVYYHIPYYEEHFGQPLLSWVVWVLVDQPEHRQAAIDEMDRRLNDDGHPHLIWPAETTQQAILSGSNVLRSVFRIAGASSFLLVVCVSVAILIISIEERRTEFATLLAIGYPRRVLARSILVEGLLLLLPAAILGAICVWIPFHDRAIMFDTIFRVRIGVGAAAIAIGVSAFVGLGAAIVPAWRVFKVDVLSALR